MQILNTTCILIDKEKGLLIEKHRFQFELALELENVAYPAFHYFLY